MSRPIFYYIRNGNNHPVITVCLFKHKEGMYARGVSVCSPRDQFDRSEGQAIAEDRAYIGVKILENSERPLTPKQIRLGRKKIPFLNLLRIKRAEVIDILRGMTLDLRNVPLYKISTFNEIGLTKFEKTLLTKINKNGLQI